MVAPFIVSQTSPIGKHMNANSDERFSVPLLDNVFTPKSTCQLESSRPLDPLHPLTRSFSLVRLVGLAALFASANGQVFPPQLQLSSISGVNGLVLNGGQANDFSGRSVSCAGDVNGDGVSDILVGAPYADPTTARVNAGKTYVVFGKKGLGFGGTLDLSGLNGRSGFILNGEKDKDYCGWSVSSAGDVNGDGMPDLLVGAPGKFTGAGKTGKAYVVFGRAGLRSKSTFELSSLDGTTGFILNGDQTVDQTGYSVSSAGDVNGDGMADLLVGAPYADPTTARADAGKTYVVFGRVGLGSGGTLKLSSLDGKSGFILNGDKANEQSGVSVSTAGDVNGDGVSDFLVGARRASPTATRGVAGKTYVVFGRVGLGSSGTLELSSLDGRSGFTLNGELSGDESGWSVSSAGDVNDDGVSDLLVGARYADPTTARADAGKTYVVFGKVGLGSSGALELSSLNRRSGLTLLGDKFDDQSGWSVSSAGDVNGDGVSDLLVGARSADPTSFRADAGKTYVVFGKRGLGNGGKLELSSLDGKSGFTLNGEKSGDLSGVSVSSAGDVNGDGVSDFLVGARHADLTIARVDAGKTYVVFGRKPVTTPPSSIEIKTTPPPTASTTYLASLPASTPQTPPSPDRTASKQATVTLQDLPSSSSPPLQLSKVTEVGTSSASVASDFDSPVKSSLGVYLGIAGGVCAVVSSVVAAVLTLKCRSAHTEGAEMVVNIDGPDVNEQHNRYGKGPSASNAYGESSFFEVGDDYDY